MAGEGRHLQADPAGVALDEPPTNQEGVKVVLRGIRRTIGTARAGKAPATADVLMQMVALCPDSMIGGRDRALLALGFAGAFRRSELCALEVDDLVEVPDGLRVLIRRSKTDQTGEGQEVAIPRGYKLRPVEAVQTWLAAAEISAGPVFRAVALGGRVSDAALADDSASRIGRSSKPISARHCASNGLGAALRGYRGTRWWTARHEPRGSR